MPVCLQYMPIMVGLIHGVLFTELLTCVIFSVAYTDSDKEISLLAKLLNDADEYSVKLGASMTGDPSHATYKPLLEYKTPHENVKGQPEKQTQKFGVEGVLK